MARSPLRWLQGKYRQSLDGTQAFPENGIAKMIDAVGALFDPGRPVTLNGRLRSRVEEIRSLVAAIPRVTGDGWWLPTYRYLSVTAPSDADDTSLAYFASVPRSA